MLVLRRLGRGGRARRGGRFVARLYADLGAVLGGGGGVRAFWGMY